MREYGFERNDIRVGCLEIPMEPIGNDAGMRQGRSAMKQSNIIRAQQLCIRAIVLLFLIFFPAPGAAQPTEPAEPAQPVPTAASPGSEPEPAIKVPPKPPEALPAAIVAAQNNASMLEQAGDAFRKKEEWAKALLQYEASMRAYPSEARLGKIAACLVKLQRYDEALDAFDRLLREYRDKLSEKRKEAVANQVNLLRREIGTFMITGATPGALIFVDGRLRGEHPLPAPVPMLVNPHWVKVYKEGFVLYEKEVMIPRGGGQILEVQLAPLPEAGRIKIGEVGKRKMEVVVDGVPVGVTPWEGPVSPGPHSVYLRPATIKEAARLDTCDANEIVAIPEDAGDPTSHEMGTEPQTIVVKPGQNAPIELKAEHLGAVVRIVPNPPDAEVYVDGVFVGRGPYVGRGKPGRHVIRTKADGYFEKAEEIVATAGQENAPALRMSKDVNASKWALAGRFLLELRTGVPLASSLGGVLDNQCSNACQQTLAAGVNATLRGGYEWPNGLSIGATAGYFQVQEAHTGFDAILTIDSVATKGSANDATILRNMMIGPYIAYRISPRFPLRLGLGAGYMYVDATYSRDGTFEANAIGPLRQTGSFHWLYVEPEARFGIQLSERWSAGAALSALLIFAPRIPVWHNAMQVNAHSENPDQFGSFNEEAITGEVVFTLNPSLYVQYGF